jgi:outer membrane protein OmpA-like peptidoglycan-associated protein
MKYHTWRRPLSVLAFALAGLAEGAGVTAPSMAEPAHQEPAVRFLNDDETTRDNLIDALKPADEPPAEFRPRGLGVAAPSRVAHCARYRNPTRRGLALGPPAKVVAMRTILFAFNSAELQPAAAHYLDQLGQALSSPALGLCCFTIEGHTDGIGSDAYNDRLSMRRAQAVVQYLTSNFRIEAERLQPAGRGKRVPVADNATEEGRSQNRRVQIVNLGYGEAVP